MMNTLQQIAVLIVRNGDQVAMVRRVDNDRWVFPAGKIEAGETALQAAMREAREETGLDDFGTPHFLGARIMSDVHLDYYYTTQFKGGLGVQEPAVHKAAQWRVIEDVIAEIGEQIFVPVRDVLLAPLDHPTYQTEMTVGEQVIRLTIDRPISQPRAHVISIHGAGTATRARVAYLVPSLMDMGCRMVRFDHAGHGESTGTLDGSTLHQRLAEVRAVIDATWDRTTPLVLIGSSMGGFEAAMMVREYPVAGLVLICPAAYNVMAMDAPFGEAFRAAISIEKSYQTSPSYDAVSAYHGRALMIVGDMDTVVPATITDRYVANFSSADGFEQITLAGCGHAIHDWLSTKPNDFNRVIAALGRAIETSYERARA